MDGISRRRLEFALKHIVATEWARFETLASSYMADEFPNLRVLAGTGDKGRDSILWRPASEASIVIQYSISSDWARKIKDTGKTVRKNFPAAHMLIYVTNQEIGPRADSVVTDIRSEHGLFLDVRDATWFTSRIHRSTATEAAAEEFAAPIVDPLLAESGLINRNAEDLSTSEARAAVLFLSMQWEDESRNKGLTKLSFEALVKAVLRHTDNENRMSLEQICSAVRNIVPDASDEDVNKYTVSALGRLSGRAIRHWKQDEQHCLAFEERERLTTGLLELELLDADLATELSAVLQRVASSTGTSLETDTQQDVISVIRTTMESLLMQRGEAFVRGITHANVAMFASEEVLTIATQKYDVQSERLAAASVTPGLIASCVESVLVRPSSSTQRYMRALADAYTLFAFLRQTPDVQGTMWKLFGRSRIWLDTSAILPLLAEMLLEPDQRSYTRTLRISHKAGMRLFVTQGVIEELYHHILIARHCQHLGPEWRNRTPFLYAAYLWSGRASDGFRAWTVEFMGERFPKDDIAAFLADAAGIKLRTLHEEVDKAPDEFRWAVERHWETIHLGRRQAADSSRDVDVAMQLARHDTENFLGILMARAAEDRARSIGYEHWWLTLDRRAYQAAREIAEAEGVEAFDSPVMSYDFLIDYAALGPNRSRISKAEERLLPLMLDMALLNQVPEDIVEVAESTRSEMEEFSERRIRREIRDRLDMARLRQGRIASGGFEVIEKDLRNALVESNTA